MHGIFVPNTHNSNLTSPTPEPESTHLHPPVQRSPWAFLRPYKKRIFVAAILLLATSSLAMSIPQFLGRITDALANGSPRSVVMNLALAMIGVGIAQAITRIASRVVLFNAARGAEYDLRSHLFRHLLTQDAEYFRIHSTGDVMSRLTNDVQTVRAMWGPGILNMVNTTFIFLVALPLMLRIDPVLTAWAMIPYPSMVLLGLVFGRGIYKTSRGVQRHLGILTTSLQEDLTGIAVIKSYDLQRSRLAKFRTESSQLLQQNMALARVRVLLVPTLRAIASVGPIVVIYKGGQAYTEGRIEIGQLVEFNAYLALLVWPTLALGWLISLLQRGQASWDRLRTILAANSVIQDGLGPALPISKAGGRVEIRNLTIYRGERPILQNVSLTLPAGTTTAIVGRTGVGKSTFVQALPRLLDTPPDSVFLDDRDVCSLPLSNLRSLIGFAPQEAFLFSTTIAMNIRFGVERREKPPRDEAAMSQAIWEAARAAGLERDLEALPDGIDTLVGERGITLSGGQRQRVALARALATQPRVLLLDDSLSSVDAETERQILVHLRELMKDRTSVLISHRLAAVRDADQIAVIDDGRVVELGTHCSLLAQGGVYAEIYATQANEEAAA